MNTADQKNNYVTLEVLEKALIRNNQILRKEIRGDVKKDTKKIVDSAIEQLAISVQKGFDEMSERFEKIDEKLEGMDSRIVGVNNRLDYHAENYIKKEKTHSNKF